MLSLSGRLQTGSHVHTLHPTSSKFACLLDLDNEHGLDRCSNGLEMILNARNIEGSTPRTAQTLIGKDQA